MSKILLVEDDPVLQEMYKDIFTHEGYEIQIASDGREGIDKMKAFRPDIVLLDLILPVMTGFTVLDIVNKDPEINKIPIIVMTNIYADAEDLIKNHGVKAFLIKAEATPIDVINKVKSIIQLNPQ